MKRLLALLCLTAAASYADTAAITACGGCSSTRTYPAQLGMKITVGASAVYVSQVGRICVSGNSGSHQIKIILASSSVDVTNGSATVSMSGCTAGTYVYASLPAVVTLAASTAYYVVSYETTGGDIFYDQSSSMVTITSAFSAVDAVYWDQVSTYVTLGSTLAAYVPPNLMYSLTAPASSKPQGIINNPLRTWWDLRSIVDAFFVTLQVS